MNKETKKAALALLKENGQHQEIHATDDGNLFFNKHHAQEHARRTKSELTTISREVSAEDKAPKETTAEASNTSAEITPSDALSWIDNQYQYAVSDDNAKIIKYAAASEANGKVTLKVAKDFGAGKENKRGKTKNNG